MNDKARILVVEDDRVVRNLITTLLNLNGYSVLCAATASEAISMLASNIIDLILLDLILPDIDGMEVLNSIRSWSEIPIIVISSQREESDIVNAFDSGADDYITKPFGNNELLARIRTVLRLYSKLKNNSDTQSNTFSVNGLKLDYIARTITVDDKPIHLTPIEYRIFVLLTRNAGKVLTHDYIIRDIWGPYSSDRQVLWVNIANIRRKIEPNPSTPRYLLTESGIGYRIAANTATPNE